MGIEASLICSAPHAPIIVSGAIPGFGNANMVHLNDSQIPSSSLPRGARQCGPNFRRLANFCPLNFPAAVAMWNLIKSIRLSVM